MYTSGLGRIGRSRRRFNVDLSDLNLRADKLRALVEFALHRTVLLRVSSRKHEIGAAASLSIANELTFGAHVRNPRPGRHRVT